MSRYIVPGLVGHRNSATLPSVWTANGIKSTSRSKTNIEVLKNSKRGNTYSGIVIEILFENPTLLFL